MSDITNIFENTWKTLHESVAGANCVSVRPSNNKDHFNFYINKGGDTSRVEIPQVALGQDSYES